MDLFFKYGIVGFIFILFMNSSAMAQLNVMISGGFNGPYQILLPEFEKSTGVKVTTLSGASQGTGPLTIKAQLQKGTRADVVIMSREGLTELIEQHRILAGSDVDLAIAPLGAGVATGAPIPDISTVDALKKTLLELKTLAVPGSTSGIYLTQELFPRLGLTPFITVTVTERGSQSAGLVASGKVKIAIQPSSELVNVPGVHLVGSLPDQAQLLQTFSAAIVQGSEHTESAKQLIQLLRSEKAREPIQKNGMLTLPK